MNRLPEIYSRDGENSQFPFIRDREISIINPMSSDDKIMRNAFSKITKLINDPEVDDNQKIELIRIIIQNQTATKDIISRDIGAKRDRKLRLLIATISAMALTIAALIAEPNVITHYFPISTEKNMNLLCLMLLKKQ